MDIEQKYEYHTIMIHKPSPAFPTRAVGEELSKMISDSAEQGYRISHTVPYDQGLIIIMEREVLGPKQIKPYTDELEEILGE